MKFKNPFKILKNKIPSDRISVGIDIGSSAVKIVKLKISGNSSDLLDFVIEPVKPDLAELLKKITSSIDVKIVNTGFSGPATVIRYVNFPRMNLDELKQALRFEAQKHIPFNVSEVNLDVSILKNNLSENKMLVLLAAAKKDAVKQRLKLLEDVGLATSRLDIDSIALINSFNFNYPAEGSPKHKAVALLNIGASFTNLNILEESSPRLSRDLHIGGNNFSQKLADLFAKDFASAEALKLKPEQENLNKTAAGIETVLSSLAHEVRVSFDYYESQCVSSVGQIFLSGGGSLFPGLKDMLANLLGIEVEQWDPFKRIQISSAIDSKKAKEFSSQLAIAVGLALR